MGNYSVNCADGLFCFGKIPFEIKTVVIAEKMRISPGSQDYGILAGMVESALKTGVPRAIYRAAQVSGRMPETILIDGISFRSRLLSANIGETCTVFPYVATCGRELDEWSRQYTDPFFSYVAEAVKESVLASALKFLYCHLMKAYGIVKYSRMAPGSLADWPIEEQKPFFRMMGGVEKETGVILTENYLMIPSKSVSGIIFPSERSFESCMVCHRSGCRGRKAEYDRDLFDRIVKG